MSNGITILPPEPSKLQGLADVISRGMQGYYVGRERKQKAEEAEKERGFRRETLEFQREKFEEDVRFRDWDREMQEGKLNLLRRDQANQVIESKMPPEMKEMILGSGAYQDLNIKADMFKQVIGGGKPIFKDAGKDLMVLNAKGNFELTHEGIPSVEWIHDRAAKTAAALYRNPMGMIRESDREKMRLEEVRIVQDLMKIRERMLMQFAPPKLPTPSGKPPTTAITPTAAKPEAGKPPSVARPGLSMGRQLTVEMVNKLTDAQVISMLREKKRAGVFDLDYHRLWASLKKRKGIVSPGKQPKAIEKPSPALRPTQKLGPWLY